tara:strand:+ start:451 stop:579 length:129 start_codon:yes stop_codon:yes gene_type:complete
MKKKGINVKINEFYTNGSVKTGSIKSDGQITENDKLEEREET